MIRKGTDEDFEEIFTTINDAAIAYKGVIPPDRWHEPYMTKEYLQAQIEDGVRFSCYVENHEIIGVMGIQDGVDYLLRALHHLVYDLGRRDVFCVLIGGLGSAQPSLRRLATQLGLDDYVWFTGWVSDADLLRYIASADICVDPDPSNPFNDRSTMTKMLEYMAQGKPIVAFDLPEHRFTAQAAAMYARPSDELEFARAVAQLMDDPARRQAMGVFARRRVETELAWHYSARNLVEAYRRLFQAV